MHPHEITVGERREGGVGEGKATHLPYAGSHQFWDIQFQSFARVYIPGDVGIRILCCIMEIDLSDRWAGRLGAGT